ncbi:MAG: flavodoxin [Candidatus Aquicultorales bacterium]
MKAVVVYESLWGNTAAIARAIAEGIGPGAKALSTAKATPEAIADADLIVAGAPVLAFHLPSDRVREDIAKNPSRAPSPPDLSHPSMRSWLKSLAQGNGRAAAFETRIWWSPGGSTKAILKGLETKGYRPVAKGMRFIVTGQYGPLKEGEIERARQWGAQLARSVPGT